MRGKSSKEPTTNQETNNLIAINNNLSTNTTILIVVIVLIVIMNLYLIGQQMKDCYRKSIEKRINTALLQRIGERLSFRRRRTEQTAESIA